MASSLLLACLLWVQALAATGGKSTLTATEWILSHRKMESINTTVGPSSRQQQLVGILLHHMGPAKK
jgi:hypothetical protein